MGSEVKWVAGLSFLTGGTRGAVSGVFYYYKSVLFITVIPVLLLAWNHNTHYTTSLSWGFWMYVCSMISFNDITQRLYAVGDSAIGVDNSERCWTTFLTVGRISNFMGVLLLWVLLIPIQDMHWVFHIIIPIISMIIVFFISSAIAVACAKPIGMVTNNNPKPKPHITTPISERLQDTTISTPIRWLGYLFGGLIVICVVIRPFI